MHQARPSSTSTIGCIFGPREYAECVLCHVVATAIAGTICWPIRVLVVPTRLAPASFAEHKDLRSGRVAGYGGGMENEGLHRKREKRKGGGMDKQT